MNSSVHEMLYGQDEMDIPIFTDTYEFKISQGRMAKTHKSEYPKEYHQGRMAYFSSNFVNPFTQTNNLKEYVWWQAGLNDQAQEHFKWKA